MRHHAYFTTGSIDEGVERALAFGKTLGLEQGSPDLIVLRPPLFSVEEARKLVELASRTASQGDTKLIVVVAPRLFHEAQNALLKTFEEPPAGTYLVLVIPSDGSIIATLRSRLLPLPEEGEERVHEGATVFLAGKAKREAYVEKLLNQAKSDKAEDKQAARAEVLALAKALTSELYERREESDVREFLQDLNRLTPILHERSAPLKPILEHLMIVAPGSK